MEHAGSLRVRARIYCADERAMGPGRADLLEAIQREGSISAAGRKLGMSYRYTWLSVDSMNRCFKEKLVATSMGGGPKSGANLTPVGQRVLQAYRSLEAAIAETANQSVAELLSLVRDEPLPPG